MSNLALYAIAVLIWGSTWLSIKFQLGIVDPAVSVVWRFAIASLLLFAYGYQRRVTLSATPAEHRWLALQGILLFGANYVAVYLAERTLPSGIVAMLFSLAVFFNLAGARLWFGTRIEPGALAGALLGVAGVVLVFSPQLSALRAGGEALTGAAFALSSALIASLGTLVASRIQRHGQHVVASTAWSMLYGALFVALYVAASARQVSFDFRPAYLVSLAYLSVFGSVVAFTAYLTLVRRIGPGKAGYSNVAVPIVALLLSTLFEDLRWQPLMLLGAALCIAGNVLVLQTGRRTAR